MRAKCAIEGCETDSERSDQTQGPWRTSETADGDAVVYRDLPGANMAEVIMQADWGTWADAVLAAATRNALPALAEFIEASQQLLASGTT